MIRPVKAFFLFVLVVMVSVGVKGAQVRRHASAGSSGAIAARLRQLPGEIEKAMKQGKLPGAVILVGHDGSVVYSSAIGYRRLVPRKLPMRMDTIFDMASCTKVVATTTAILQLFQEGKIRLDDPVAEYWPAFGANGKQDITVRELMTHYSGLPPDLDLDNDWSGYDTAMQMIIDTSPILPPGTRFLYSDINYETLGELVHRISGEPLNVYCERHIFKPLGMKDTQFVPPASLRNRIAPTQHINGTTGPILWGTVHDPTARRMGGVAGHAGLFSDARDLSIFCQMLLNGGSYHGVHILNPLTVEKMTTPQSPPDKMAVRGLGWDIASPFASNRGQLFPVGSFGHTGFTGPSLWIDPVTHTYVIFLTNRVHPDGTGDVVALRSRIDTAIAAALGPVSDQQVLNSHKSLTGYYELMRSYRVSGLRNGNVRTGIDVLEKENFAPLKGLRVGLITNETGEDSEGRRTIDLLNHAPGVQLKAIFSPEHGLWGRADSKVASSTDPATGLPVYSLYGKTRRPTGQMLEGLDALVYDIQAAGVRFYTFITTLGYGMEAASQHHLAFYVLDRPNPLGGSLVEGPILDSDLRSFVGYFPLPVRYGMTVGELAEMYNDQEHLGVNLHVVRMQGYERTDWYDETGLQWMNPSPNLRSLTEAILYPGVGMIEGANVSVGRGTDTPFELLGAPWINGKWLAVYLNSRDIQGVRFLPTDFTPQSSRYAGEVCHGVQIFLVDRQALDAPELGVELASALHQLFPKNFELDKTLPLVGSRWVLKDIGDNVDPDRIEYLWQAPLMNFRKLRAKYLLYPEEGTQRNIP
ncbi:MAG TPA: exo-beta-N-acetylmuramidase NamZ domain-containing protein [Terriglobia bacterium]|nr:exo-beta-N-acetylmuramidase NamZ domain-containing protein [Terriglobia bacterium]